MQLEGHYLFELNLGDKNKLKTQNAYKTGNVLFKYTGNERQVRIPKNIVAIGESAFDHCQSVEEIILHDNIQAIYKSAFSMCTHLKKIELPSSIKWIDYATFGGCERLKEIVIGSNIKTIEPCAFQRSGIEVLKIDEGNEYYEYKEGLLYELKALNTGQPSHRGKAIVWANHNILDEIVIIPSDVIVIGEGAFGLNSSLKYISLPCSCKYIEKGAFSFCTNLERCRIPGEVKHISDTAFHECEKLVIECFEDSYAQKYAEFNHIEYTLIFPETNIEGISETAKKDFITTSNKKYDSADAVNEAVDIIENGVNIFKSSLYEYRKINPCVTNVTFRLYLEKKFQKSGNFVYSVHMLCDKPQVVNVLGTTGALGESCVWKKIKNSGGEVDLKKVEREGSISVPVDSWESFNSDVYNTIKFKHLDWKMQLSMGTLEISVIK